MKLIQHKKKIFAPLVLMSEQEYKHLKSSVSLQLFVYMLFPGSHAKSQGRSQDFHEEGPNRTLLV